MEEYGHIYVVYKFNETDAFTTQNGELSDSEREDLYFYLRHGRGKAIEGTGGLKEIRCGDKLSDGKGGWDVVFAAYNFPARRIYVYYLLVKYHIGVVKKLTAAERMKLKALKEDVDKYVRSQYGKARSD